MLFYMILFNYRLINEDDEWKKLSIDEKIEIIKKINLIHFIK